MPDGVTHPSPQELRAFVLGKLPEAKAVAVAGHLGVCAACRQAVKNGAGDSFLGKVRATRPGASPSGLGKPAAPAAPPANLPPELANHPKYRIVRELGRGGMGVVYQAVHTTMDRTVALKVINPTLLAHPDALPRFQAEVKAAARLDHPHIVRAHDADHVGNLHLLVMEFIEGTSLAELVQQQGPLSIALACQYVRQAALGLQHAFEQGMAHRDIKPQNLMVTPRGVVKVLDFGLARLRSEQSVGAGLTADGAFMGTPEYVAPEQATDARTADTRSDLYSLGCTLYFLLTGRPPFEADTAVLMVLVRLMGDPEPLHKVRPDVPLELSALVARLLARDPAQRYQTPVELAQALVPFITPEAKRDGTEGQTLPAAGVPAPTPGKVKGSDTSPVSGLGKGTSPLPVQGPSVKTATRLENLAGPVGPATEQGRSAAKRAAVGWWKRPAVLGGAGAAVLFLFLLVLGASVVLRFKTRDGTIVLENLPADAEVLVDGEQVKLNARGGKPAEISVAAGRKHQLQVNLDGIKVFGEEVEVNAGGRRPIQVRLEPAPPPADGAAANNQGFVPLFNGKDLAGWKSLATSKATWEVKDAVLTGRGDTGYLFRDGNRYENFHLRVEAKINEGGNGGVTFRAPFGQTTPQGHPAFGYAARINITHKDPNKTGSLYLAHKVVAGVPKTPTELNEWFTLEVIADGPHVIVRVNRKVATDFIDLAIGTRSGRIALQVLGAATVVQFRKIEIKELPPGDLRLQYPHSQGVFEQVKGNVWLERNGNWLGYFREHARNNDDDGGGTVRLNRKIENDKTGTMHITRGNGAWWNVQGTTRWTRVFMGGWSVLPRTPPPPRSSAARVGEWVPLLNGKDLSGWGTAGNKKTTWTYEGDALMGHSSADPAGLLLSDRADYENFHLRMETQLGEGACGSLFVRCGPSNDGTTGNKCYAIRIGEFKGVPPVTGTLVLSAHLDEVAPLVLAEAGKTTLKPGEWFPMEVIAEGNRLRVLIGGKTVVDSIDTNKTFTVGRIGLVCRGKALAKFRKLEVKELPPTEPGR